MTDPLSVTTATVGILSFGLGVCKGILDFYNTARNSRTDVKILCESTEALSSTLSSVKNVIGKPGVDSQGTASVRESVSACEAGLHRLNKKLSKVQRVATERGMRSLPLVMQYPFRESTITKIKEMVTLDLMGHLRLAVGALNLYGITLLEIEVVEG